MTKNCLNKKSLVAALRSACNISINDAAFITNVITAELTAAAKNGKRIKIRGFGSFETITLKQSRVFNFHSRKVEASPPRKTIKFKPCAALKTAINTPPPAK